jgi:hypothetical protein
MRNGIYHAQLHSYYMKYTQPSILWADIVLAIKNKASEENLIETSH